MIANKFISDKRKEHITTIAPGDHVWVNLRFFGASFYDSLPIDNIHICDYYVEFIYGHWSGSVKNPNHWITATCPILGYKYTKLDNYFVYAYGSIKNPPHASKRVTEDFILACPELLSEDKSEVLIARYSEKALEDSEDYEDSEP